MSFINCIFKLILEITKLNIFAFLIFLIKQYRYIDASTKTNKRQITINECYIYHAVNKKKKSIDKTNVNLKSSTTDLCIKTKAKSSNSILAMFKSNALTFHLILHCYIM